MIEMLEPDYDIRRSEEYELQRTFAVMNETEKNNENSWQQRVHGKLKKMEQNDNLRGWKTN